MVARSKKSQTTRGAAHPPVPAVTAFEAEVVAGIPATLAATTEPGAEGSALNAVSPRAEVSIPTLETIAKDILTDKTVEKIDTQLREAAESIIVEGRKKFDTAKVKAQGMATAVESSAETLTKGLTDLNAKSISAFKTNIETGFEYIKAVVGAKNMFDAWKLHTDLSAKHIALLNEQANDLAKAASKCAADSVQPFKTSLDQVYARS